MTARRLASERRIVSSLPESALSRRSVAGDAVLDGADIGRGADQQLAQLAAVLADRVELGLELGGDVGVPLLLGLDLLQLFLPGALGSLGRDRDAACARAGEAGGEQHTRAERRSDQPARCLEGAGQGHHAN